MATDIYEYYPGCDFVYDNLKHLTSRTKVAYVLFYRLGSCLQSLNASYIDTKQLCNIFITFEDVDRIADRTIVHKVFAISEILTRWTTRVRILFQYDRSKLCKIFEDESYLEKYIPYTIDLTPISFGRCIKVLLKKERSKGLSCHINEKDFYSTPFKELKKKR